MTDGVATRHSQLNAGAIPASAEELAQKHQNLFQEYSKLKAQHTVLKKAVKKERAEKTSLQGVAKEKEKELRKLQGQLDILAFHNERLSKRIEAVQEVDTVKHKREKGSHFSLLGGAIKKELEKSTEALEAAKVDLGKKIEENEELHAELSTISHIYTDNLNALYIKIDQLEKRIEELQDERNLLKSETSSQSSSLAKEKAGLETEINRLRAEIVEKTTLLDENRKLQLMQDDHLEKDRTITQLTAQLAEQEQQLEHLRSQVISYEQALLQEKERFSQLKTNDTTHLQSEPLTVNNIGEEDNDKREENKNENDNADDDEEEEFVYPVPAEIAETSEINGNDQDQVPEREHDDAIKLEKDETKVDDISSGTADSKSPSQDDHPISESNDDHSRDDKDNDKVTDGPQTSSVDVEAMIMERERKLKLYYESQLSQLTDKLQMADSKACRFASLVDTLKERMAKEDKEKQTLQTEIQNLKVEVAKGKDSLATTESKYQEQLDMLTEYTTSLQMKLTKAQTSAT